MEINRNNLDILFRVLRLQFNAALENTNADWRLFCGMNVNLEESPSSAEFSGGTVRRRFEKTVAIPHGDIEKDLYGLYSLLIARMGCETGRFLRRLALEALLSDPVRRNGSAFFHSVRANGGGTLFNTSGEGLSEKAVSAALENLKAGNDADVFPDLLIAGASNRSAASAIVRKHPAMNPSGERKSPVRLLILPELENAWFLCVSEGGVLPVSIHLDSSPELLREDGAKQSVYGVSLRGEAAVPYPHLIYRGDSDR